MSLPPSYNLLANYPNKHYVETGIYRGDSLRLAYDAGFRNIVGIELFDEWIEFCQSRFYMKEEMSRGFVSEKGKQFIRLVKGDSALCLWDAIKNIKEPITFFLDSHSQLFEDEPPMENPFPLMCELEQIGRHPIKTHTIIIDDFLYLSHEDVTGWNRDKIQATVMCINPDYKLKYLANPVRNNILIAHL